MKPNSTERIVVVHNTHSSQANRVEHDVFDRLAAAGISVVRFHTPSARADENIDAVAHLAQPGDTILCATGDGTANDVVNGLLMADLEGVRAGFLSYGNFNDMAATFNDRFARRDPLALLEAPSTVELTPLTITKNGEHWRYAALYATLGWTALAAAEFDSPELRKRLKYRWANLIMSLAHLGLYYFESRHSSDIPSFYRSDGRVYEGLTDVLAVNGPIMAKIIRSGQDKYKDPDFLLRDLDVSGLLKNSGFLAASALNQMPGIATQADELTFPHPSSVAIQVDGEFSQLDDVSVLRISKPVDTPTLQVIEGRRTTKRAA